MAPHRPGGCHSHPRPAQAFSDFPQYSNSGENDAPHTSSPVDSHSRCPSTDPSVVSGASHVAFCASVPSFSPADSFCPPASLKRTCGPSHAPASPLGLSREGSAAGVWHAGFSQAGGSRQGHFTASHFLPLLTELFIALFKSHCFSSLVVRVLQAIEDEIVVDDSFVPYLTSPRADALWTSGSAATGLGGGGDERFLSDATADDSEAHEGAGADDAFASFPSEAEPDADKKVPNAPRSSASSPSSSTPPLGPSPPPERAVSASDPAKKVGTRWPLFCPPVISSFGSLSSHMPSGPLAGMPHTASGACGGSGLSHLWSFGFGAFSGYGGCRHTAGGEVPFFTKLRLVEAFQRVDAITGMTKRKVVPPSFHECRTILNLAQILASRSQLRLITMDGDETLYPDGANFTDTRIAKKIAALLQRGTKVAVVTAAGYGYEVARYHERLGLLFEYLKDANLSAEAAGNFYVMGGESNYLMQLSPSFTLAPVDEALWTSFRPGCCPLDAQRLLDLAEEALRTLSEDLKLPACILRKARAVGLIRKPVNEDNDESIFGFVSDGGMHRENLEEIVMRVRRVIRDEFGPQCMVPWSAFNGGKDVWVDIGNKAEGVAMLQGLFQLSPRECLHVGDQFGASGNDLPARVCSPTAWIANPQETAAVLHELLLVSPAPPQAPLPEVDSKAQQARKQA
ncbi:putative IMP-specific 5'-nucleotidase 1 [Besnoitia besnoiti]|uniref:IMP-specific 5'-nucleotidase 1 n=1 Tax=Besnoitia besnoiti TaxID=94643 RepID=A0A2A9MJ00_BESBE|nr:putative IMP-specific 5'-nucleotidase 1 [Besnoitia besnoiti]PFH35370.1 putative IMP-specific 5'-nucleotidase 1 [Besnoitia besnoiti]